MDQIINIRELIINTMHNNIYNVKDKLMNNKYSYMGLAWVIISNNQGFKR